MSDPRTSITVEREEPVFTYLSNAMNYWNALAGWELFVFGPPGENTSEVRVDPGDWWRCTWGSDAPYDHAWITYPSTLNAPNPAGIFAHELGHALGFQHQPRGALGGHFPDEEFDTALLASVGYRSES